MRSASANTMSAPPDVWQITIVEANVRPRKSGDLAWDDDDGLPTVDELDDQGRPIDTDGDGLPNHRDPDDDGDGVPTENEITYDKIASARISYGGRGQITDVQQPRYGQQVADIILPF